MQTADDLRKIASDVRSNGLASEKAKTLVKKAHEVKLATLLTFYKNIK